MRLTIWTRPRPNCAKRLSDPEISSYRVVLQPEKMVIREAERAVSYLGLFNYPVDSVIINRILPEAMAEGEFFQRRRDLQAKYLQMIEDNFSPLPLWRAPYYADEVVGMAALSQIGRLIVLAKLIPATFFTGARCKRLRKWPMVAMQMRIPMPFVSGGNVKLRKRGDEMFITIGNFKREMILPMVLAKRKAAGGRLRDGILEIDFLPLAEAAPA